MSLRILTVEPYYGGSHRAFLEGYSSHSRHEMQLLTMPARKWKWRMRGAAVTLAPEVRRRGGGFDVLLASDFLDLACLVGLVPDLLHDVPLVVYFHENQITYPLPDEAERDYQFAFTNITSCLAADRVIFNSHYHRREFLDGAARLLASMPDHAPEDAPDRIRRRSEVVHVGVDLATIDEVRPDVSPHDGPLRIVWNHRWEYDKAPDTFFDVLTRLHEAGRDFRLSVLGQSFGRRPPVFDEARERLADHLDRFGYLESRAEYCRALVEADVAVSTARQEFFGISAVEAAYAGCAPLLPDRLSYPELLPGESHPTCLYTDPEDLLRRLTEWVRHPEEARCIDLTDHVRRFGWDRIAPRLDDAVERAAGGEDA